MRFYWPLQSENWKETIESVCITPSLSPFHPEVVAFLQTVSKKILKDHSYRRYPELVALAYWLRKAHLNEMQEDFIKATDKKVILSRGIALHFAPSNVDTIFVYSWVLSMLAGNCNIIRISGRKQEQTDYLLKAVIDGLIEHPEIGNRTAIMTYEHQTEITQYLSERCHVRVIWGGDQSVKSIRAIPLSPLATELAFPNRFSLSVLSADAVLQADDQKFSDMIHHFYNDSFWFAQMACSSPRLVVWVGKEVEIKAAEQKFWEHLDRYLQMHLEDFSPARQVEKLTTGYLLSVKDSIVHFNQQVNFSRLKVQDLDLEIRERHCGGGMFVELEVSQLHELIPLLHDKDQTLSYFGFSREQLVNFALNMERRSIDRMVPVGQALDFEGIWDGYDLIMHFTREIVIR